MIIDVAKTQDIPALRRLWKEAFGDTDAFLDGFFCTGFSPIRCRTAKKETALLGALYWFPCQWGDRPVAYLYAVATGKAFQGQRVCSRLMEDTHRHLQTLGFAGAVLVPGSGSLFGFYEKMGYRRFGGLAEITAEARDASISLREISAESYMEKRKALLPPGSILQEGETLPFLATQLTFYAGDSWLLAAAKENGMLSGKEFLGNASVLPGILRALGVPRGNFRAPGTDRDFAMFRSFAQHGEAPRYFAFALD